MGLHPHRSRGAVRPFARVRAIALALLLALAQGAGSTAHATAPLPVTLPEKPDAAGVKSGFPNCTFAQSLAVLAKCRSDLELFRLTLEEYNSSLIDYIADLKRSDAKLESLRAGGRIKGPDYTDLHEQIAVELGHASQADGKHLRLYKSYRDKYKEQSRQVQAAWERCLVSMACRSASA